MIYRRLKLSTFETYTSTPTHASTHARSSVHTCTHAGTHDTRIHTVLSALLLFKYLCSLATMMYTHLCTETLSCTRAHTPTLARALAHIYTRTLLSVWVASVCEMSVQSAGIYALNPILVLMHIFPHSHASTHALVYTHSRIHYFLCIGC